MTLGFAPFGYWPLVLVSLAVLAWSFNQNLPLKYIFLRGLLFGLGFFGSGVSWIYISIHHYGGANIFLSLLITALFIFYLALYPALVGVLYRSIFKDHCILRTLLVFPAFWILSEFARGYLFTGFPWLDIGYAGIDSPYSNMAPLWGVYGVGLFMAISASLLTLMIEIANWRRIVPCFGLLGLGFICYEAHEHTWTFKDPDHPLSVALIQGNIAPTIKWDESHEQATLETYLALTQPFLNSKTNLIIWPEDAFPYYQTQSMDFLESLNQTVSADHSTLIFGLPLILGPQNHAYNGAIALDHGLQIYLKHHLVPFGEYTPHFMKNIADWLNFPMSDFSPGPFIPDYFRTQETTIGVTICYESAFPMEFQTRMQSAQLLISLSDDAWFGKSLGPWQHEQINQMRAKELGVYLLNSTNSGITTIINPEGKIEKKLLPYQTGTLTGSVFKMYGQTPWTQFGAVPVFLLLFLMLAMAYCNKPSAGLDKSSKDQRP